MTSADLARSTIVMVVVLAVQVTLLDSVRVGGAHPDAMLLLPMAAGYVAGPDRGAGFGFAAGLLADLFLPTTFGLSALVGCLLGYGTGLATRGLVRSSWWLPLIVAAGATAAGLSAYAILGAVLGRPGGPERGSGARPGGGRPGRRGAGHAGGADGGVGHAPVAPGGGATLGVGAR